MKGPVPKTAAKTAASVAGKPLADHRIIMLVALGSALGGSTRHALDLAVTTLWPGDFPLGILLINVSGSALIAWLAAPMIGGAAQEQTQKLVVWRRYFLMAGFCGGYTTFSVLSLDTLLLLQHNMALALLNMLGTTVLCLAAALLGFRLGARRKADPQHRG